MKKRGMSLIIGVIIIVAAIVFIKTISAFKSKEVKEFDTPQGILVDVIYPTPETIEQNYVGTGKLLATDRFEIVSQVDGQLLSSARHFKEGKNYRKGETMLEINHQEFYMNLLAQKSEFITLATSILPDMKSDYPNSYSVWRTYVSSIDINQKIPAMPKAQSEQERFFLSGKGLLSKYYSVKSGEEKLEKYIIAAPFNGVVTAVSAEAGKAVRPGSVLGTLINTTQYDLEVTIPLTHMQQIKTGTSATLTSSDIRGQWTGRVIRIGGNLDEQSQSIKVFIRTSGAELKEGMYLNAEIKLLPLHNAIKVSRKMLDNNNHLFVVTNNKLQLKEVQVLTQQGDYAIIKGLEENTPLLTTVVKNAYDGMPVRINKQ